MKFTEQQLKAALKTFQEFVLDSYADELGEDCESPQEFVYLCAEVFKVHAEDDQVGIGPVAEILNKQNVCKICEGGGCPECTPDPTREEK